MVGSFSIETHEVTLNSGVLTWLEAGRGEALVLLHGIGSSARSFAGQLAELSDGFRVIAWNAPGYSGSTRLVDPAPGVEAYAEKLEQFLDALKITRCHLVGHSLGALMAARYACDHPERVATLTLASCALGHARLAADERERLLRTRLEDVETSGPAGMAALRAPRLLGPGASVEHIEAVRQNMAAIDPAGYAQTARMLSQSDLLADIARLALSIPLQVIYGMADIITPPAANLRAAQARANTRVSTIAGAGHALYVQSPEEFNAALRAFIGSRDG